MGRYAGDVYFSGGAYYFSTLGAAEFCFLAAAQQLAAVGLDQQGRCVPRDRPRLHAREWRHVRTVRPATGAQTSARHLAWSYAAFISCVAARRAVVGRGNPSGRTR